MNWYSVLQSVVTWTLTTFAFACFVWAAKTSKRITKLEEHDVVQAGQLTAATKDDFDEIVDNVRALYGSAVIIGTANALRKITGLANVQWASESQKESIAQLGRLGEYEGTAMVEVAQRFADKSLTTKLMDDTKLYILPSEDYKIVEFVTRGETELDEITEKGEEHGRIDDIGKYELQYEQAIAVKANRQFGVWTIVP